MRIQDEGSKVKDEGALFDILGDLWVIDAPVVTYAHLGSCIHSYHRYSCHVTSSMCLDTVSVRMLHDAKQKRL